MRIQLKLLCFLAISTVICPTKAEDYSYVTNDGGITITAMLARARRRVIIVEDTERSFEDKMLFCLNGGRYPDEKF